MCYKRFKSEQCLLILKREAHFFFLQALSRHSDGHSHSHRHSLRRLVPEQLLVET